MKIKHKVYQFYRTKTDMARYLGERYFRFSPHEEKVLQICMGPGEVGGKGKGHNIGVYLISKQSFATNYLAMNQLENISKTIFENRRKQILNLLS